MIELKDVCVEFPSRKKGARSLAVNNVSLTIEKGEVFGIIGSSGAGKSTLVRTINQLQKPTSGKVIVNGVDLTQENEKALRDSRSGIGMIFQHFNLWNAKTVKENVEFPLKCAGWEKVASEARIDEVLSFVGLDDKKDAYPQSLSGGQKQRVAIARALATNAQILLCDEPTSALDLETTASVLQVLKNVNEQLGVTIVVITHELEVVKSICDRVAVMSQGEVVECDQVFEVFAHPQSDTSQALVQQSQNFELPKQVQNQPGTLLKLTFAGANACDPVLFETGSLFDVSLSIIHGKIEYISNQPFGILYVLTQGADKEVQKVIAHLENRVEHLEVISHAE